MATGCEGRRDGAGFETPLSMAFQPIVDVAAGTIFAHKALSNPCRLKRAAASRARSAASDADRPVARNSTRGGVRLGSASRPGFANDVEDATKRRIHRDRGAAVQKALDRLRHGLLRLQVTFGP